ncbi:hypothetical protein VPG91_11560 [Nitrospirillum amazonense]|uniref:hypothetical protein n=1 Tax=Nitrospirillum amazonense TaxID=28077 RepID=UPI002DD435A4|nr:hypothetical protein [Nitrospirillum amazonense]MEC4591626.1 hypothetical protein [Nitrospirillum amazonense]
MKTKRMQSQENPRIRTSLHGKVGRASTDDEQLQAMRRAAWHKQGVAMIRVDDLPNEFDRLAVEAIANELFGKREKRSDAEA